MDKTGLYKKKGSTVDSKFARLHRRSIDQRAIRGKSFMDNRRLEDISISPVKEHSSQMMPPPAALPKATKRAAASKGQAKELLSSNKPSTSAADKKPSKPAGGQETVMSRRERLQKWKAEKEMKKRELAKTKKPELFKVSKTLDRRTETNLYWSSNGNDRSATKRAAPKPVATAPAPAPARRTTRASTRALASATGTKGTTSRTRAPIKPMDPAPTKRPRRGPTSTTSTAPSTKKSAPQVAAPHTRQSARLAGKQVEPPKPKQPKGKGGTSKQMTAEVKAVDEPKPVVKDASLNVTNERGGSLLTETFAPSGFQFTMVMDLPDIPFTPLSPISASNFMFPPAQRRCSTPYSTRLACKKLQQSEKDAGPIPVMDFSTGATFNITNPVNSASNIPLVEQTTTEMPKASPDDDNKTTAPEMEVEAMEDKNDTKEDPRKQSNRSTEMETENKAEEEETSKAQDDANLAATDMVTEETESKPVMEVNTAPESTKMDAVESDEKPTTDNRVPSEPEKDVNYFKNLVTTETARLLSLCDTWEGTMTTEKISEEVCGEIRSTIGKAKLLMNQRFKQFSGLIENCEFGLGEKATHVSDLDGFWEMIYYQVEDVDALFKDLDKLKASGWKREEKIINKPKVIKKKKPVAGKKPTNSAAAASRNAARERLMAAKAAMKAKATRQAEAEKVVFEGGFFKVESPARKNVPTHCEAGSPFRTSRHTTPVARTSRPATPKMATPKMATTPVSQLFSPLEPRRSLRTKLCGEINKLVLSDKKRTTPARRTPARTPAENHETTTPPPLQSPMADEVNKENEVDLTMYLQPCAPVISLNEQAEELMVTEPETQLEQLGVHSPKKNLRPRRSLVKPKDVFSPCATTRSKALNNSTNTLLSGLCSPQLRKTRKSSLGFGLSAASSLFSPATTPVPCAEVNDLICFDSPAE